MQPGGQGLQTEFDAYFKLLSDADKQVYLHLKSIVRYMLTIAPLAIQGRTASHTNCGGKLPHSLLHIYSQPHHARGRVKRPQRKPLAHPSRNEKITHRPCSITSTPWAPSLVSHSVSPRTLLGSLSLTWTLLGRLGLSRSRFTQFTSSCPSYSTLHPTALPLLTVYGCVALSCARLLCIDRTGSGAGYSCVSKEIVTMYFILCTIGMKRHFPFYIV